MAFFNIGDGESKLSMAHFYPIDKNLSSTFQKKTIDYKNE
jgi:hypothetical protein